LRRVGILQLRRDHLTSLVLLVVMRRLLATVVLALAVAAPAEAARKPAGTYVGLVGGNAVAAVVGPNGVRAFVTDGETFGTWLKGKEIGRLGDLRLRVNNRLQLSATYKGKSGSLAYEARPGGLFRSEITKASGKTKLAGWVVFAKHKQLGVVISGSRVERAPSLALETLTAEEFVAGRVTSPRSQQLAALDVGDDGFDITEPVRSLLLGKPKRLALPEGTDDDGIVAVSAGDLKKRFGYELRSASGRKLTGLTGVTGGLRLRDPFGATRTAVSAMHFLNLLGDGSGRLDLHSGPATALRMTDDDDFLSVVDKLRQDNPEIDDAIAAADQPGDVSIYARIARIRPKPATAADGFPAVTKGSLAECTDTVVTVTNPSPAKRFRLDFCGYAATR
jgi:hypothetical protein